MWGEGLEGTAICFFGFVSKKGKKQKKITAIMTKIYSGQKDEEIKMPCRIVNY